MKIAVVAVTLVLAPAALADEIQVDSSAPVVAGLHVTSTRALSFSVSEYSLVHATVRRSGRRVRTLERAFMPGMARICIARGLRPGSYTATVTANDAAHNYSQAQVVRFRLS